MNNKNSGAIYFTVVLILGTILTLVSLGVFKTLEQIKVDVSSGVGQAIDQVKLEATKEATKNMYTKEEVSDILSKPDFIKVIKLKEPCYFGVHMYYSTFSKNVMIMIPKEVTCPRGSIASEEVYTAHNNLDLYSK